MAVHKKFNHSTKTNALGRGLDALISTEPISTSGSSTINEIAIDQIEPNPNQPRREFDDEALKELASSIAQIGIIQPITLRQVTENRFQIIAGERRWRASQLAGLKAIPAYIRTIQVQMALQKKEIDMGHARALLSLDSPSLQIKLFKEIQKNGYSVRKVEELVQQLKNGEDIESGKKKIAAKAQLPEEFNILKQRLSSFLNTKVQMTCSPKGKGKISIPFSNEEELEHIMNVFDKLKEDQQSE